MKNDNPVEKKSFDFAVRIVKLSDYLAQEKKTYVLAKQVLKSGTSIGANVAEHSMHRAKPILFPK